MVIAKLVNKISGPRKINGPTVGTGWDPWTERTGVDGPLTMGGRGVTDISVK